MNQQHRDILTAIGRKQPITTSGVAEYLMDHFGYGGGMEFDVFRDQVSKTIGYLKNKGEIVGEDIPQSKGKPLRYWSLANPQSECQSADHSEHDLEMASDVAEIEQPITDGWPQDAEATHKESLTVAETVTPEPISVEVKATLKPLTARQLLDAFEESGESYQGDLCDFRLFSAGAEFAEKHHGIGQ